MAINSAQHAVIQKTPYEIIFKHKIVIPYENPLTQEIIAVNMEKRDENDTTNVVELLKKNKGVLSAQFNKARKAAREFKIGDLVLVRGKPPAIGGSRKLLPKYRGQYEISKVLGNDRYIVRDIEGE